MYGRGSGVCRQSPLAATPVGAFVRDRLDRIAAWADATGRYVEPFVPTSELHSAFTGETRVVTRFPVLALAEFDGDGDDLSFFTPCRDGDGVIGVPDRLGIPEGERTDDVGERSRPRSPPGGST